MSFTDQEYEEIAIQSIQNYLNKSLSNEYIKNNFSLAIKRMIYKAKQFNDSKPSGVRSITEGDTSVSFDSVINTLVVDGEVKALLPAPYIKMY
jgi:hypothetical protein